MKKKMRQLSRAEALSGVPVKATVLKMDHREGKAYLTFEYHRPVWQRMVGGGRSCKRTFALDSYGEEVYDMCDGKNSVQDCVRIFARGHHLSLPEAELAVTTFMKTLTDKGVIGITLKEGVPEKA